jgi:hypothetical protein
MDIMTRVARNHFTHRFVTYDLGFATGAKGSCSFQPHLRLVHWHTETTSDNGALHLWMNMVRDALRDVIIDNSRML